MPRPNLEHAIKKGVLTPAHVATFLGITAPTVRKMVEKQQLRCARKPPSGEISFTAIDLIHDIRRLPGFADQPLHPRLLMAAVFYVSRRAAEGTPIPIEAIPPEVIVEQARLTQLLASKQSA